MCKDENMTYNLQKRTPMTLKRILLVANYQKGVGGISGQVELLHDCLNDEGYTTKISSVKGNPLKRLWLFCKLLWEARRYDVLHVHGCSGWGMLPIVYGVIAGRLWHKRVIVTYHGGGAADYFAHYGTLARRWLCGADQVIVLNGYLDQVFTKYAIPHVVIPNIINFREDVYIPKKVLAPKMVSVRHLTELYRIDIIIRAFAKVVEKYPDATLDILGHGDKRKELGQLVHSDERLSGRVRFVGQVPNEQIYDYLQANDIMISAPKIDNMPVSVLEAMNAGMLVISSNVGGVPYIIEHGKTGLLFDGTEDALVDQIVWALMHQDESLQMIKAAHADVKKYNWNEIRKQLLVIYNDDVEK